MLMKEKEKFKKFKFSKKKKAGDLHKKDFWEYWSIHLNEQLLTEKERKRTMAFSNQKKARSWMGLLTLLGINRAQFSGFSISPRVQSANSLVALLIINILAFLSRCYFGFPFQMLARTQPYKQSVCCNRFLTTEINPPRIDLSFRIIIHCWFSE